MRHHGSIQNPPIAVRLTESPRVGSVSQQREAHKPGAKKVHVARGPEALSRRRGEPITAERVQELWSRYPAMWISTVTVQRWLSDFQQKRITGRVKSSRNSVKSLTFRLLAWD